MVSSRYLRLVWEAIPTKSIPFFAVTSTNVPGKGEPPAAGCCCVRILEAARNIDSARQRQINTRGRFTHLLSAGCGLFLRASPKPLSYLPALNIFFLA